MQNSQALSSERPADTSRADAAPRFKKVRRQLAGLGLIEGLLETGLEVYRGVRYAQAPFGPLRFEAPQPAQPWQGVMPAFEFAPAAPQAARSAHEAMYGGTDCLALNIWCPAGAQSSCPVMVWIPGGAYMRGNAGDPIYDGAAFARHGIVFVSLNYRVGMDGFMQIPGAPANRGLLDQLAALRWVKQHIETLGGDPEKITLAGGSAGAGAISCLMGVPEARGLYSQVILQSPSLATQTAEEAQVAALAIAGLLKVPLTREAIASIPLADAVKAVKRLADDADLRRSLGFSTRNFFPLRAVVDGALICMSPLVALREAWAAGATSVRLLVGSNREEMRLYSVPSAYIGQTSQAQLGQFIQDVGFCPDTERIYAETLALQGKFGPGEILCAMQSDYYYRRPARHIAADAALAGQQVYLYEFDWQSSRCDGTLGAAHGLEIPFVFDQLATEAGRDIAGPNAPQTLATQMHSAWVNFVKGSSEVWPRYSPQGAEIMRFDVRSQCCRDEFSLGEVE